MYVIGGMNLRDPETFTRVYREYAPAVERVATRLLGDRAQAQDVVHDVFLRLWVNPVAYDPARADVGSYLRLLARSRALDAARARGAAERATERARVVAEQTPATADPTSRPSEARDARRELVRALHALPEPQSEAVVLSFWGDLPDQQVASRAGVPVGTAKSRIRLGLQRLRAEYQPV